MTQTTQLNDLMDAALTISQLIESYASGEFSPRQYLDYKLQQAKQDSNHAWISLLSSSQLDRYLQNLEQQSMESLPLFGVPFAIKDNIDLDDLPTTAGCEAYRYQPDSSAFVVQLLIKAGAVPLGKTNLDQFATGLVGTRSPYGAGKNSFDTDYISGGSSAGSAISVAHNQVMFALGTDTAGSGRVPAAFNNLYGLKASKGLLSCSGVVPACKSLDCVTLFAKSADELAALFEVCAQYDAEDCFSRAYPEQAESNKPQFKGLKIGVPAESDLTFFGNTQYQALYYQAVEKLQQLGAILVPFNLQPFTDAARLLYQGPWVAERYVAIEDFYEQDPQQCLPVIQTIIGGAKGLTAAEVFKASYQLQAYKVQCDQLLQQVDLVLTPTAGNIYTIDELTADPITLNTNLGYYTNFMNLLDYCAVAVPAGFTEQGLPFGVTLFASCFSDQTLLQLAQEWQRAQNLPLGATGSQLNSEPSMDIMVCGAHMQGLPLNHQLTELGASLRCKTTTSPDYRFYKLAGGPPLRPGLVRDNQQGREIEVEVWSVPKNNIGTLLAQIPHPLGLGSVELANGEWVKGFICEPIAVTGAEDISSHGSWRTFLASLPNS
ncbi:allophanate hydrolase [Vibrio hippocampi]|uniref:Allophanate hydrolase n=1 Tax=Vibrio hippocampi TaxID=654686 RepID=A0ABM8ZMX9_9VIBR|nr:allophanate hydrolase [Vibrio hippocampi]CAH0529912.1 Allophanate hydrolase [Vibrio hippocampi]